LLEQAGLKFIVVVPSLPEPDEVFPKLPPTQQAEALAYFKARATAEDYPDDYILGADTIVAHDGRVFGKASDSDHARRMLGELSGSRHQVVTGVALLGPEGERLITSESTFVTMRKMTDQELDDYIRSGEWENKAGAYAIQETADRFVEKIEGSFSNVVGLPVELVIRMLHELKTHPDRHRADK